jgi:Protein of unknown function (DUF2950)
MNHRRRHGAADPLRILRSSVGALVLTVFLTMPVSNSARAAEPAVFDTPEAAAQALLDAMGKEDRAAVLAVLGTEFQDELFTEEQSRETAAYRQIVAAAKEVMQLREDDPKTRVMVIGKNAWPVPIPIVHGDKGWMFDTAAGIDEILARRIGQDELETIETLRAYVDAQVEYAGTDRDGDEVLEYAQKVISTEGKKDGLFWQVASAGDEASPFGPFVAELPAYVKEREAGEPFMGYYYRILTRQGENAPGGRYDYIINGNMIAGFAAVAVPAEYAETGVMTFLVSHQGKVYEKDLGDDTAILAAAIQDYNPDGSWIIVEK